MSTSNVIQLSDKCVLFTTFNALLPLFHWLGGPTLTRILFPYKNEPYLCWFCFIFVASQCFFCIFDKSQCNSTVMLAQSSLMIVRKRIYFQFIIRTNRVGRANIISRDKQNTNITPSVSTIFIQKLYFVTQNMQTQMTEQCTLFQLQYSFSFQSSFCLFVDNNKLKCMNCNFCFSYTKKKNRICFVL